MSANNVDQEEVVLSDQGLRCLSFSEHICFCCFDLFKSSLARNTYGQVCPLVMAS